MLVIPALVRLRLEDHYKLEASMGNRREEGGGRDGKSQARSCSLPLDPCRSPWRQDEVFNFTGPVAVPRSSERQSRDLNPGLGVYDSKLLISRFVVPMHLDVSLGKAEVILRKKHTHCQPFFCD